MTASEGGTRRLLQRSDLVWPRPARSAGRPNWTRVGWSRRLPGTGGRTDHCQQPDQADRVRDRPRIAKRRRSRHADRPPTRPASAPALLLDASTRHGCIVFRAMPRWLIPWVVPVVLVVGVIAGATVGVWALVAVFIAAAAVFAWLRLRQLDATGQRDEVSYTRLSDLLRRRR